MNKWQWWNNRKIQVVLLIQLLLLAGLLVFSCIRQNKEYYYDQNVWTIEEAGNAKAEGICLPIGIYKVRLEYVCDNDMAHFCTVNAVEGRGVLCSGEHLNQGLGQTDYDLWITLPATEINVSVTYGGGTMELCGLRILQTDRDLYKAMFILLACSAVLDGILLMLLYQKEVGMDKSRLGILVGLGAVILIASIPLGNDHLYAGSDITYHLLRVGNIKDGFLSGQFPVRLDPTWLFGNGYASSVCYGELFLYLPAFLRLIGFTLQGSWMWFLFVLNVAVCLVSYYSFRRILKDDTIGFICSSLYTLSLYRLYKEYSWSAVGEVQAMIFLPLILYAVWGIYTDTAQGKRAPRHWLTLAIGMSGLVQCHVLTCELVVFFLAVVCIVLIRKTLRKEVLLAYVKAIIAVCVLNAWFIIPFLDYMLNMDMVIHHVSARTIQENGLLLAQLLFGFFHRGESRNLVDNGLRKVEAMGVGIPMIVGLSLFLAVWFWTQKRTEESRLHVLLKAGKLSAVLGALALCMSLSIFPWTQLQFINALTQRLISSIQYPNRFLMIATVLLTFTAGIALVWIKEHKNGWVSWICQTVFTALVVITAVFYMDHVAAEAGVLKMYDEMGMGTAYLSGAEYLPYGTNAGLLTYHDPIPGEGVMVSESEKEYLDVMFACENITGTDSYVDMALLYYKGYTAVDENGEKLPIAVGENGKVRVEIPAEFDGQVHVYFASPWYWRGAELVSVVTVIGFALTERRNRRKG